MAEPLAPEQRVEVIRAYARTHFEILTFIETGTANGDTTAAVASWGWFTRLYTIEFDYGYYLQAVKRFARSTAVRPLHGDSTVALKELLFALDGEPAVFWLDAHMPGPTQADVETPIEAELREIFWRPGRKVVLIDDARLFGEQPGYPTIEWIEALVADSEGDWDVEVKDDIIRITPAS